MGMSNFVKLLSAQPRNSPNRLVIYDPEWEDVEAAISDLDSGNNRFFELSESANEASVMTVFGNSGVYHIAVIDNETKQSWLMFGSVDKRTLEIGGNLFPMHQICHNGELARTLIRSFFETGAKSSKTEWYTIDLQE